MLYCIDIISKLKSYYRVITNFNRALTKTPVRKRRSRGRVISFTVTREQLIEIILLVNARRPHLTKHTHCCLDATTQVHHIVC